MLVLTIFLTISISSLPLLSLLFPLFLKNTNITAKTTNIANITIIGTIGNFLFLPLNLSKSLLVVASKSDSALLILSLIFGFTLLNSSLTFEIDTLFISMLASSEDERAKSSTFFSLCFAFDSLSFF